MTINPKLDVDGSVATFNYATRRWESDDAELAEQLQQVLLNLVRSPEDCMQYFVANFDAIVLERGEPPS